MPVVTIDGREVEVETGTNLIEAGLKVGVQIPHYCYHPSLSVVGQCRMCLVKVDGMPKLQAGCTTQVMKDGMVVKVDDPEVMESQEGIMEFLLVNHPLDCPICDQAGECGLQDYSFKHGQAFSRFRYEEKRTYPGRERIPLGPHVLLNMNRCIQCTRCVRFTEEVTGTGELGFFERGSRAEIGVFPGKVLDNDLSTCVVDICPVGALTSTQFRFAERVWYLDKKPSICTGCDVGCNITLEHRRGAIRRYKPRCNPEVNDYWMCDFGRGSFERYNRIARLESPRIRNRQGDPQAVSWKQAVTRMYNQMIGPRDAEHGGGKALFVGSGFLTTEESYLLSQLATAAGQAERVLLVESGPKRTIPTRLGARSGTDTAPNRRGAELVGMAASSGATRSTAMEQLLHGATASECGFLFVADSNFGPSANDTEVVKNLRKAKFLAVMGWANSLLAQVADVALPCSTHAETEGTFINVDHRLQRFERAFPAPGQVRSGVEVLAELVRCFYKKWSALTPAQVFERMTTEIHELDGLTWDGLPAQGVALKPPVTDP